jgi:peptide/nickel transport system permease protein
MRRIPLSYIIRHIFFLIMVVWTAASINFILPRLTGRDVINEQLGAQIATQGRSALDAKTLLASYNKLFGLDKPLWQQYVTYIVNAAHLNFGYSITFYPRTVMDIIISKGQLTLPFVAIGIFFAFTIGVLLGALLGWRKSPSWLSAVIVPFLMAASSIPQFVVAMLLINFLAFRWNLFPLGNPYPPTMIVNWSNPQFIIQYLYHAALPILTIVIVEASGWALGMRAMMVTVEGEDYVTYAEARGLKNSRIFFRYMVRNAFLPALTGLALRIGFIITGAAVAETYFDYAGLGSALALAITGLDYFVMYGIVIIMVMCIALATFIMDIIYPLLDPRITYNVQKG